MIRRPPRSTLFPTRRSSDLELAALSSSAVSSPGPRAEEPLQTDNRFRIHEPVKIERVPCRVARHRHERSEEHTSELQSQSNLVCRLLLEKKKKKKKKLTRKP